MSVAPASAAAGSMSRADEPGARDEGPAKPALFLNPMENEKRATGSSDEPVDPTAGSAGGAAPDRTRKEYLKVFNKYDADMSGAISRDELGLMLAELGQGVTADLEGLMEDIELDGNGEIGFEAFMDALQNSMSEQMAAVNKTIEDKIFGTTSRDDGTIEDEGEASYSSCCGLAHPMSGRRQAYDIVQLLLLLYTMFSVPLQIAFAHEAPLDSLTFWVDFGVWVFFLSDLGIQMNTYYLYERTGQWVSDGKKIRSKYFRGWAIVDVAAVMPVDYILRFAVNDPGPQGNSTRLLRLSRLFRYLRLLKVMSAQAWMERLNDRIQAWIGFSRMTMDFVWKLHSLLFVVFFFTHLMGCMWIFFGRSYSSYAPLLWNETAPDPPVDSWWDTQYGQMVDDGLPPTSSRQYVDALYFVIMTLTTVGYGDITPKNVSEKWFCYMVMFATAFVYAYVVGVFADMVANRRSDKNRFESKMRSVFEFLEHVECPDELKDAAKVFYEHRFPRKTLFDEEQIYRELPPRLTKRLVLHRFESTIHSVPFFRGCTDECVTDICRQLRGFVAQAGDVVLKKGEHNHELIIVSAGEATGVDGTLVTHFKDGSFFGELEFLGIVDKVSQLTVTADTDCDLYSLRLGDIARALIEFPDLQEKLNQYAKMRKQAVTAIKLQREFEGKLSPTGKADLDSELAGDDEAASYDVGTASAALEKCSKAQLQAAVLKAVLNNQISKQELRDLG